MADIRDLLEAARDGNLAAAHFRGLLHVAIGRRVTTPDGAVVSAGVTWRELAGWLKLLRFNTDLVTQFGADPEALAPRDRNRFWYAAIAAARVDSPDALADAEALAEKLVPLGFVVGPPPAGTLPAPRATTLPPKAKEPPAAKEKDTPAKSPPKPKKKR